MQKVKCFSADEFYEIYNKKDAGDGTWTHTTLLPQAPEACASANSATPA